MSKEITPVRINEQNPKSKFKLVIHDSETNKDYVLRKTRVGGILYGEETAEILVKEWAEKFMGTAGEMPEVPTTPENPTEDDEKDPLEEEENPTDPGQEETEEPEEEGVLYLRSVDDLNQFITNLNSGIYDFDRVELRSDIDCGEDPITSINSVCTKEVTVDGKGHTIKNMKIVQPVTINAKGACYGLGLFANYKGKVNVYNLTFDNAYLGRQDGNQLTNIVGVVFGYVNADATLKNVTVKNSYIEGYGKVGTFAGYTVNDKVTITIKNCTATNTKLDAGYNVGGLVGLVTRGNTTDFTKGIEEDNNRIDIEFIRNTEKMTYCDLDTDIDEESCIAIPLPYHVKGLYATVNEGGIYTGYLYGAFGKKYVSYASSRHDCRLVGTNNLLADSEICID